MSTANLRTNIMDFRGIDSSIILIVRGRILMSIGDFPESLSQAILVGIMLVGRLGVYASTMQLALVAPGELQALHEDSSATGDSNSTLYE